MMQMLAELDRILSVATAEVAGSAEGHLSLGTRQRIWAALGPREVKDGAAVIGPGLRRRTLLATLCCQAVSAMWREAYPDQSRVLEAIDHPAQYFEGQLDWDTLWIAMDSLFALLESSRFGNSSAQFAGYAIASSLGVALKDEQFEPGHWDQSGRPAEDEYRDWDCAYFACLAYSGQMERPEPERVILRRAFWNWYLERAVRDAAAAIA